MADVNKSVEISYRADIKQLLANLKQMPGITEKQAKEMVTGLNKQLRQAEKAAARAAKTTVKSFDQMGKAANRASINARGLRKDFANIDRLSSEASQALMVFSPAMGEAAATASEDTIDPHIICCGDFLCRYASLIKYNLNPPV